MTCESCGRAFTPALPGHRVCRVCWFEREGDYEMALADLAWQRGYELAEERTADHSERIGKALDSLPLRDVISLCHPDRHPAERCEQANRGTRELLALRSRLEEAKAA